MKLLETIKIIDGVAQNLEHHSARAGFAIEQPTLQTCWTHGVVKWRLVYENSKVIQESFEHYKLPNISSLKLVDGSGIDYAKKYENRTAINNLYLHRGVCSDIIIVKDGFVTDSSFCNLVFANSQGLFTSNTPLLAGTKRAKLIAQNTIIPKQIRVEDICNYEKVMLINAMIDLSDDIYVEVEKIVK